MHRRPLLSRARAPLGVLAVVTSLAACSSAVKVVPFERSDDPVCREVAARWPATVGGEQRREVAVQSEGVAAWGDPVIIARCGAQSPGPTTDQCLDIEGVDWVAHELADGVAFVTYGRDPAIEVLVPLDYAQAPLLMAAFTAAAEPLPQLRHCS